MRVTIIGAGNVGTHLGLALHNAGHEIVQVLSRSIPKAKALADQINAEPITLIKETDPETDLLVLAVKDDTISHVYEQLKDRHPETLVVHTAGSKSIEVFNGHTQYGVIWPIQSLSAAREIDMSTVPLVIDANTPATLKVIEAISRDISNHVYHFDDNRRAHLHVAATFANNFSNHMYSLAEMIADAQGIPFDILKPLISETARKIEDLSPEQAQTGAAIRSDVETMQKHMELLKDYPDLRRIYEMLSVSIRKQLENDVP